MKLPDAAERWCKWPGRWGYSVVRAYRLALKVQCSREWINEGALIAASNVLLAERKQLLQCLSGGDRGKAILRVSRTGLSLPEIEDGIRTLLKRRIALKETGSLAPNYEQKSADIQANNLARDYADRSRK